MGTHARLPPHAWHNMGRAACDWRVCPSGRLSVSSVGRTCVADRRAPDPRIVRYFSCGQSPAGRRIVLIFCCCCFSALDGCCTENANQITFQAEKGMRSMCATSENHRTDEPENCLWFSRCGTVAFVETTPVLLKPGKPGTCVFPGNIHLQNEFTKKYVS